ncbi:MAG: DUF2339 domain-containing protein [Opitutales bacterium]|nr:DUF2339 domain-containing protein [Opitutales bacterium]
MQACHGGSAVQTLAAGTMIHLSPSDTVLVLIVLGVVLAPVLMLAVALNRLGDLQRVTLELRDRLRRVEARMGGEGTPSKGDAAVRPAKAAEAAPGKGVASPSAPAPDGTHGTTAVPPDAERRESPRPPAARPRTAAGAPQTGVRRLAGASVPPPAFAPVLTEARVGQRGLLIAGIVVMVLGVGYFLQYSFQQGWVSPPMRVLMTYLGGTAVLAAGEVFRRRGYAPFGLTLAGGGVVTYYFATFAGYAMYGILPPAPAFILMAAVTALAGTLAVVYNNRWLAVLGLVGGFLTPVLIQPDDPSTPGFLLYLAILNAGVLGISFFRQWGLLHYLGAAATWLVYAVWFFSTSRIDDFWWGLGFSNFVFFTYAAAPVLYAIRKDKAPGPDAWWLVVPNTAAATAFGLAWIADRYSIEAGGVLTLVYAAFFTGLGAWLVRRRPGAEGAFTVCLVKGILFTGLTIPLVFSGPWITVFWALAAGAMAWAGTRLGNRWVFFMALLLAVAAVLRLYTYDYPVLFAFEGFASGFAEGWGDRAGVRLLIAAAVTGGLAALWRVKARDGEGSGNAAGFLAAATGAHLFAVLNMETQGFFLTHSPAAAPAALSVIWALFSIVLMGIGFRARQRTTRWVAIVLFAVTLGKVLLVDMAEAATPFRILSSIALGILMIAGSFLYHRFKDVVEPQKTKKTSHEAKP